MKQIFRTIPQNILFAKSSNSTATLQLIIQQSSETQYRNIKPSYVVVDSISVHFIEPNSRGGELLADKTAATFRVQPRDLVISKLLRQELTKYISLFPQVSAALELSEAGKSVAHGHVIQYIHTTAAHKNPLRRVMPLDLVSKEHDYDKEKYREMLLQATESILGYFGFDRYRSKEA